MQILMSSMSQLLDEKLTLIERGLMVTVLLLKDSDPKLTLAKVKAKVKMNDVREELINLHSYGLIKWSGYKQAQRTVREKQTDPQVVEVITFMNDLYKRDFNPESKSTVVNLVNRLLEYSVEEIKRVVANRYSVWKEDPIMYVYLNPTTIFRPSKFDKYLEETNRTGRGESFLQASKTGLRDGDEITLEISKAFINTDTYTVQVYDLTNDGKRIGNGSLLTRYGRDLKRNLLTRENSITQGGYKEFEYIYKSK